MFEVVVILLGSIGACVAFRFIEGLLVARRLRALDRATTAGIMDAAARVTPVSTLESYSREAEPPTPSAAEKAGAELSRAVFDELAREVPDEGLTPSPPPAGNVECLRCRRTVLYRDTLGLCPVFLPGEGGVPDTFLPGLWAKDDPLVRMCSQCFNECLPQFLEIAQRRC